MYKRGASIPLSTQLSNQSENSKAPFIPTSFNLTRPLYTMQPTTQQTTVCARARATGSATNTLYASASRGPQCCHCGWRGEHAPNCPFK
ncbi:hypothetical protein B0H15DRAFT_853160 [Mycena belliarum]|uniref:Uncharacterized protein n=1 Tax=Mycena belliarum TaxID=1033014 RepID=A0AAD6TXQ8_9AGAR|nr:hypothetical protein B0H15DRAFT_853160 [Mycena belliae]